MGRNYTDEDFIKAVRDSTSMAQVIRKINLVAAGGNYHQAKLKIKKLNLDTSHFLGQAHLRGKTHSWAKKTPLDEILVKDCKYNGKMRTRLLREGIFENKCYECGISEWKGKSLSCELEHKNGDKFDNRIENLTFLCPNCHSQTKYFRGRNKYRYTERKENPEKTSYSCTNCKNSVSKRTSLKTGLCVKCYVGTKQFYSCGNCSNFISKRTSMRSGFCSNCYTDIAANKTKIEWPPIEIVKQTVAEIGYSAAGRKLGVSGNAIRKRIKTRTPLDN